MVFLLIDYNRSQEARDMKALHVNRFCGMAYAIKIFK